ncbi:DUF887 domain protein [Aspergillus campestris IBT 28561]|uniref:DUF887 domain protein n=1 Tax=Aspergillus campestris (strain IBT 28561) TaxID=1392248 RepID=A0A2I1D2T2_ASPC2|nr:DUF887 domain protein [Aspergillus campestris IBT 28561]PKY04186.1 DUF887 domain protein [Aspergillus campestris IBT 28561]
MLDPIPPPPAWLRDVVDPWAQRVNLPGLSDHFHEVIIFFLGYQFIHSVLSPWLSPILFPHHYPSLNKRTKLNWDVHVVSLIQSISICVLALWVMFTDKERQSMTAGERVYGYTGGCALVGSMALGYFVYDLIISTMHLRMFGVGMLFHAISALWVFSFGFRPFVNYYCPIFILYELSSPFLNIHWFLDKINMTGSNLQWYNGMALLFTFFSCRLIWGTWQSVLVYKDMWYALKQTWDATGVSALTPVDITTQVFQLRDGALCVDEACARAGAEISKYASHTAAGVPTWLVLTYVASNLILNSLNYYWFSKMVETVLKRFRPENKDKSASQAAKEDIAQKAVLDAATKLEEEEGSLYLGDQASQQKVASGVDAARSDELKKRTRRA